LQAPSRHAVLLAANIGEFTRVQQKIGRIEVDGQADAIMTFNRHYFVSVTNGLDAEWQSDQS
jgi:hypothetical protein